jgi:hypothetical protein
MRMAIAAAHLIALITACRYTQVLHRSRSRVMALRVSRLVAVCGMAICFSRASAAQATESPDEVAAARICALASLRPNRIVRVQSLGPDSYIGPLEQCGDSVLVLGLYAGQETPHLELLAGRIRRVWVRSTQGKWGLVAGAISGGVIVGALAAAKTRVCTVGTPPVNTTCHGDIGTNAAMGAAVGGLLGFLLGREFPRWARVFP